MHSLNKISHRLRLSLARRLTPAEQRENLEALRSELEAVRSESASLQGTSEHYKRIVAEAHELMAKLRDERDSYKIRWETASSELRRPTSRSQLNCHHSPAASEAHAAHQSKPAVKSPLRILCVGTGRDGTTSLSRIMQDVFDREETGEIAKHEWASSELNMLFCDWMETKDPRFEDQIRDTISGCAYACATGNGYAAVLPVFAELFGDQLTLVHLRRRNRAACIASLVENAEVAPHNHLYYTDSQIATRKRPTAFHFGEMSKDEWMALSLSDKFGWYYDKTHDLIEQHRPLFKNTLSVDMEDLNDDSVRAALARTAGSEETPRAFHVNRFVDLRHVPQSRQSYVQRLLGQLNVQKLADDDLYGVRDVLNEFVFHLAHFPDETPGALDELRWTLIESYQLLGYRRDDLKELMDRVGITPDTEISKPAPAKSN